MSYSVKEMFYTLQGEGAQSGRPAVFCRFSGCNLWSGRESDRKSAICQFCDTDFVGVDGNGGGKFRTARELAIAVVDKWPHSRPERRYVVCTGGEPLLQFDDDLVEALHEQGFEIAIETNGTLQPPQGIDWICVSPKANADFLLRSGQELKLVFPQDGGEPERSLESNFQFYYLQPMDGPDIEKNTQLALQYCLQNPRWQLSLQTHKMIGIP